MNENSELWRDQANCVGAPSDAFFPDDGQLTPEAAALCRRCPVRLECRDYALTNGLIHGIWGGLGENDRRRVRSEYSKKTRGRVTRQDDFLAQLDEVEKAIPA